MGCKKLTYSDFDTTLKVVYGDFFESKKLDLNYYPFGVEFEGRKWVANERNTHGFQGQLLDDDIKGEGNSVNYKYRMHDPRIGRFFAIDPLAQNYAHNSPYAFSENRVIDGVELEGLEFVPNTEKNPTEINAVITVVNRSTVVSNTENYMNNVVKPDLDNFYSTKETSYNFKFNIVSSSKFDKFSEVEKGKIRGASIFMTLYDVDPKGNSEGSRGGEAETGNTINGVINMYLATKENVGMSFEIVMRDASEIISNFRHEIGHLQGLHHPWEESIPDIKQPPFSDIRYNRTEIRKFENNIMNSDANPIEKLRPIVYGEETITDSQRQKAKSTILKNWDDLKLKPKEVTPVTN